MDFINYGRYFSFRVEEVNAVGYLTLRDASRGVAAVFDAPPRRQSQLGFPSTPSTLASIPEPLCSVSAAVFSVSRRILA